MPSAESDLRSAERTVSEAAPIHAAAADEALVTAAMSGEREAIRALWERNRRWVAAVILAHKPGFEDLDDLLQEVAMTFVAKVSTLRDESNLGAWLRTVAVNAARAAARRGRLRPRPGGADLDERPVTGSDLRFVSDAVADDDESRRLLARVARLPETYREPLLLRAVQGMRSRQIADTLGIEPATVDTRIARARRMLREPEVAADEPHELESTRGLP